MQVHLRCALTAGSLLAFVVSPPARGVMPSDVDLRSAYCLPIVNNAVAKTRELLDRSAGDNPAVQAAMKKTADEKLDEFNRLQAYLMPKLTALDSTAIALAMSRAQAELAQFDPVGKTCSMKCAPESPDLDRRMACLSACFDANPAMQRVKSCFPVNWRSEKPPVFRRFFMALLKFEWVTSSLGRSGGPAVLPDRYRRPKQCGHEGGVA